MNDDQMECGNENPPRHLPSWQKETTKKTSHISQRWNLNSGSFKHETSALPLRHHTLYFLHDILFQISDNMPL